MKNASRNNKFLLCFRPVVDMDQLILESKPAVIDHGFGHSRPFKCFNSENKASVPENVKKSDNSMLVRRPLDRTLSKVIKAVLFETILAKRVPGRKSLTQDSFQSSKHSFSRHAHKSLDSRDHYNEKIKVKSYPLLSSQSSVGSSSSSSSTSSCSTSSISEPKKQNENSKNDQERVVVSTKPSKKDDDDNMGGPGKETGNSWCFSCAIWLLIIILAVTCIWGRLHAIFCTTICLYYLPRQSTRRRRWPENEVKRLRKSQSGEYKRKMRIIIEGLLERNHHKESALNT